MATTLVSVREYLTTSYYEPDAEYVDGVIEERAVGEYDHSSWQAALIVWFRTHGISWNVRVRAELRVQVSETRFRVPDVVVIDRDLPIEQVLTAPPVAVIEILSPEDTVARTLVKLDDYEKMGVHTILVIDPRAPSFYRYRRGNLDLCQSSIEQIDGTDAVVDWNEISKLLND